MDRDKYLDLITDVTNHCVHDTLTLLERLHLKRLVFTRREIDLPAVNFWTNGEDVYEEVTEIIRSSHRGWQIHGKSHVAFLDSQWGDGFNAITGVPKIYAAVVDCINHRRFYDDELDG